MQYIQSHPMHNFGLSGLLLTTRLKCGFDVLYCLVLWTERGLAAVVVADEVQTH